MRPRHAADDHQPTRPKTRMLALVAASVLLAAAAGVGVWGLWNRPEPATPPVSSPSRSASPSRTPAPTPSSGDPEGFARLAAQTLFDWDTRATTPGKIRETLLGWADPTGEEANGLAADLANYLPDQAVWQRLASYQTVQRLEIISVAVPVSWEQAQATDVDGLILPGTTAFTVDGVRHREGMVDGQPSSVEREVSFTVFVTCAPSFPECRLMRLSQPDNPLR